nr:hypothetical protein [Tanacetum cinerariifolium]
PVLGYLKFSAKGTKREVSRMPILGSLITVNIQEASYYQEYLENVAKHRRPVLGYLKFSAKGTKREVSGMPILGSLITVNIQEAFYYQEYLENVAKHRRYLAGKNCSLKNVAESVAEDEPAKEPQVAAEDTNFQKALEESMKTAYAATPRSYSEEESKKVVLGADEGGQHQGQAGPDPDAQAEGQMGSDADHEHMDLDVADVSPQPSTEQLDKGFTAMAYPKISALKIYSSTINLQTSIKMQKNKVESMVNVSIQQDLSSISLMTSPIIDLTLRPESPKVHQQFKATTTNTTTTTTTTTLPPPQPQQQSIAEAMMMKHIGELEHIMANLIQVNKYMKERLDKHRACLYMLERLDIPHQVSKAVEVVVAALGRIQKLQDLLNFWMVLLVEEEDVADEVETQDHPEIQEILELLDPPKCRHHHFHLYPPIKKVSLRALLHQAHQR